LGEEDNDFEVLDGMLGAEFKEECEET